MHRFSYILLFVVFSAYCSAENLIDLKHENIRVEFSKEESNLVTEVIFQLDSIEPQVELRNDPSRVVVGDIGDLFNNSRSFAVKNTLISSVHFVNQARGDLVVFTVHKNSNIRYSLGIDDSNNRVVKLLVSELLPINSSVVQSPSSDIELDSAEEFLKNEGKVLLPSGSTNEDLEKEIFDDLDFISNDAINDAVDHERLELFEQTEDSDITLSGDIPRVDVVVAPARYPDWLVPLLSASSTVSWLIVLLLLSQLRSRKRRRKKKRRASSLAEQLYGAHFDATNISEQIARYYEVLGASEDDSDDSLRSKYKHLVKIFHSDMLESQELSEEMRELAAEKFKEIQTAFEALREHRGL